MNFIKQIWNALTGKTRRDIRDHQENSRVWKAVRRTEKMMREQFEKEGAQPAGKQRTKANLSDFVIVKLHVMGRASAAQLADQLKANRRSVVNVLGELKAEGKVKPVGKTGPSGKEILWELA